MRFQGTSILIKDHLKLPVFLQTPFHNIFVRVNVSFIWTMDKGFASISSAPKKSKKREVSSEPQGRLISWSPWPPANFQTRYPAFPFVLTILIIVIGQWYLSLLR